MFRDFLAKYSRREQVIIIVTGLLVLIWLVYQLLLEPLIQTREQNAIDYTANRELLAWMQKSAAEVKALGGSSHRAAQGSGSSAVVVVESALQQGGLTAPKRIEPNGNNKAVLQYDAVDFNKLMQALDKLEHSYAIQVSQATISRTDAPGMASALINLERVQP